MTNFSFPKAQIDFKCLVLSKTQRHSVYNQKPKNTGQYSHLRSWNWTFFLKKSLKMIHWLFTITAYKFSVDQILHSQSSIDHAVWTIAVF